MRLKSVDAALQLLKLRFERKLLDCTELLLDAIKPVLDPTEPTLHGVQPVLDPVEPALDGIEALFDPLQASDRMWYSVSSRSKRL